MSDTEARKSMDDVLASIRRIVRAEREANEVGADDAEVVATGARGDTGDAPLALTPEMMSETDGAGQDGAVQNRAAPETVRPEKPVERRSPDIALAPRASDLANFVKAPEPIDPELDKIPSPKGLALDEEGLRNLIRDVIREELANGEAEGLIRDIIKSELTTGEVGSNISRNVLRLVRSEVAKARG